MLLVLLLVSFAVAKDSAGTPPPDGPVTSPPAISPLYRESLVPLGASPSPEPLLQHLYKPIQTHAISYSSLFVPRPVSSLPNLSSKPIARQVNSERVFRVHKRIPSTPMFVIPHLKVYNDESIVDLDSATIEQAANLHENLRAPGMRYNHNVTFAKKDRKFINEIRKRLKSNNEDYLERKSRRIINGRRANGESTAYIKKKHFALHHRKMRQDKGLQWRASDMRHHGSRFRHRTSSMLPPAAELSKKKLTTGFSKLVKFRNNILDFRNEESESSKNVMNKKLQRFMSFVNKNRAVLKEFIAKKKASRTRSELRGKGHAWAGPQVRGVSSAVLRAADVIPKPEQLDLAPAKGARVSHLRAKGRLCQRHVMKPEGPKYDSQGNTYMPEFKGHGRRYEVTVPRRFVLPVCCNCCSKSVLGCE